MVPLSISEVGERFGMPASTLRYYERIGVLLPANRVGGRRTYDQAALRRLALIVRARQSGFRLKEIRELFSGFEAETPASRRWQQLSARKLAELDASLARIMAMKTLLRGAATCRCETLDQCGAGVLRGSCVPAPGRGATKPSAHRARPRAR